MQNMRAPLEKRKVIEFKDLGKGLRCWREILAVLFYPRGIFSRTFMNFFKVGPVTKGLR